MILLMTILLCIIFIFYVNRRNTNAKITALKTNRRLFEKKVQAIQLHFPKYISTPCTRCAETYFFILEVSPNGRSLHVECQHCKKKTRFKASPGAETKDVAIWWKVVLKQKKNLDELAESCGCIGEHLIGLSFELDTQNIRIRPQIPSEVKQLIWERDGAQCAQCGSTEELQYDHIIPFSQGGSSEAENLQILCGPCNRSKGAKII